MIPVTVPPSPCAARADEAEQQNHEPHANHRDTSRKPAVSGRQDLIEPPFQGRKSG